MREICSYGSVGEPVGNHRLYPDRAMTSPGRGANRKVQNSSEELSGYTEIPPGKVSHPRKRVLRRRP